MISSRFFRSGLVWLPLAVLTFAGCGTAGRSPSDIALAEENYRLKSDQEKLRQQLAAAKANSSTPAADLKHQLEQSDEKLSHAVRSYSQAQEETAKLQTENDKARAEIAALTEQVQQLKSQTPAPAATAAPTASAPMTPATSAPTAPVNPDTEANLATALHSYALVSSENDQLKSERDQLAAQKSALESQISAMKGMMPLAAQAEGLREQLRQTQAQSAAFAEENERLRSQLSINGVGNSSNTSQATTIAPTAVATVPDPTPTPTPVATTPEPKMHTVAAGDTLSKISLKYYGTASRWPEILAANRDTMKNENSLVAGRKIKIP